ncbi:hypothetical protein HWV62_28374 [Athelia sp. TMB]|nr:hypothetical protein HWV62_28374 [Athelia sp. TMB]
MLAATLPPTNHWHTRPERRGRSKRVSAVALARQASEERRREAQEVEERRRRREHRQQQQRAALSCSLPTSTRTGHSPSAPIIVAPPPPLTRAVSESHDATRVSPDPDSYPCGDDPALPLTDRIQIAYAHDDVARAKMLLLELTTGVRLADPADPRVAAVTDADFDAVFAPPPALVSDAARVAGWRAQTEEAQRRGERLRVCERVWETERMRVRDEKARVARARAQLVQQPRKRPSARPAPHASEPGPSSPAFEYDFPRSPKKSSPLAVPLFVSAASPPAVPFKDVLAAMHGPLFPEEPCDTSDLLAALLAPCEPAAAKPAAKPTAPAAAACPACTSASACTASSRTSASASTSSRTTSTALSRTSSWLSFARSSVSASTAPTTPATSPSSVSSWLKSAPLPARPKASPLRHSHVCAARLTPVALADCPLSFAPPRAPPAECEPAPEAAPPRKAGGALGLGWVAELARAVHGAALFSVTAAASFEPPRSPSPLSPTPRKGLRPAGTRVCAKDVRVLMASDAGAPVTAALFIPLVCPFPPPSPSPTASSSSSSSAAAQTRQGQGLTKSPYRPAAPHAQLAYRMRPVGNPVFLRLRALQNVVGGGVNTNGNTNALGCGRERVVGVAWEGRRRSGLGCEVRVGVF